MSNEPVLDNIPDEEKFTEVEVEDTDTGGMGLGVKIIVGVVALAVIAALLIPFLSNNQSSEVAATPVSPLPQADAAIAPPEATAQANPESPEAQFELGNFYYESGQLGQAIDAYQQAIALDPNYQAAYANLGVVYYSSEQFDLAAAQYEKALELKPQDGDVAYNLGALYLQQALEPVAPNEPPSPQLINKAITQLETAMEISPDLPEPHFTLGVAYLASNQQENALKEFETFLAFDAATLDPRAISEAERYLQLLQGQ